MSTSRRRRVSRLPGASARAQSAEDLSSERAVGPAREVRTGSRGIHAELIPAYPRRWSGRGNVLGPRPPGARCAAAELRHSLPDAEVECAAKSTDTRGEPGGQAFAPTNFSGNDFAKQIAASGWRNSAGLMLTSSIDPGTDVIERLMVELVDLPTATCRPRGSGMDARHRQGPAAAADRRSQADEAVALISRGGSTRGTRVRGFP